MPHLENRQQFTPLHTEVVGQPDDAGEAAGAAPPPLVLLHGFTQNTRCWGPFGEALGQRHLTVAVDAPGHGQSTRVRADLPTSAEFLAESLDAQVGRPAVVIGYSMGGRLALHLARARPDLVAQLVLIGATAGIEDAEARSARQAADDDLADRVLAIGIDAFIDEWLDQDLFAGLTPETACRTERLANDPEGLASSLRLAGTGTQAVLWDRLGELTMPVLVLAGSDDPKFRALGSRLVESIGANSTLEVIDRAGHAVHLERPIETAAAIETWMAATGAAT